jgi:hypothetical protein
VVVITVDGTDIQDWANANVFTSPFGFGLLSTRTGADANDVGELRASAYATFGAGTAVAVGPGSRAGRHDGAIVGLLGESISRAPGGLVATAIGDGSGTDTRDAPASLAVMRLDGTAAISPFERLAASRASTDVSRPDPRSPGGRRTDPVAVRNVIRERLRWASLVVVDTGDTARADRTYADDASARAGWMRRALVEASVLADDVRAMLGPKDTLMVASLVPPATRVHRGVYLGAIAFTESSSLPTSATTRQDGVVTLTDLAPTVLQHFGEAAPAGMTGRPIRFVSASDARSSAVRDDWDYERALRSRQPLTRVWLIAAALLSALAFVTVAAGRGSPARQLIGVGLLAAASAPAAFLIAPLLPGDSVVAAGWWTAAIAIGAATFARVTLGQGRALAATTLVTAVLYAVDLIAGSPLAARSALGFQIAGGGRFYGLDEGMLGVLLAAPLVAAGISADRSRDPRRATIAWTIVLAGLAVLAAAPAFGSKFGAPYTLVPGFGVFVTLAAGHKLDRKAVIGIAVATVLLSASLAVADALSSSETASHIGRELVGRTAVGSLVARKLTSLVKVTTTTVWLPAAAVIAGLAVLLLVRRRDLVARAMWGKPAARAALWGGVVGCAFALVSNDTGIITVAAAAPIIGAAFYGPLLVPDQAR